MKFALMAALLALGAGFVFGGGGTPVRADTARTLTMTVLAKNGQPILLEFLVLAADAPAAEKAAEAALPALTGGGARTAPGGVSAQFELWGWQWAAQELPVPVGYNPAGAAVPSEGPVQSALAAWSSAPGSRFRFQYAGETSATPGVVDGLFDGLNTVGWKPLSCSEGCVLAVTSKAPGVHESDIVLNSDPGARLGDGTPGTADVETVVLHELGHLAGLEHPCEPLLGVCSAAAQASVMYPSYQGTHRNLESDDIAGMVALYPVGAPVVAAPRDPLPVRSSTLSVELTPGWNLRVLPAGPLSNTLSALPCVRAVYAWTPESGWVAWIQGAAAALNSLSQAGMGSAYWVVADGACAAQFTTFE